MKQPAVCWLRHFRHPQVLICLLAQPTSRKDINTFTLCIIMKFSYAKLNVACKPIDNNYDNLQLQKSSHSDLKRNHFTSQSVLCPFLGTKQSLVFSRLACHCLLQLLRELLVLDGVAIVHLRHLLHGQQASCLSISLGAPKASTLPRRHSPPWPAATTFCYSNNRKTTYFNFDIYSNILEFQR